MSDYYCRFCDRFIYENEATTKVSSILHTEVDTRCYEYIEHIVCPDCHYELVERANDCICGELKLETEALCRYCKKVAKEGWENCLESVHQQLAPMTDEKDVMEIYLDNYIL